MALLREWPARVGTLKTPDPLTLEGPAFSVLAVKVLVGFGEVGDFHVFGVPLDFFAGSESDVSEHDGFGEGAGVIEAGHGFWSAFACGDPFVDDAATAWEGRGWGFVVGEFVGGQ